MKGRGGSTLAFLAPDPSDREGVQRGRCIRGGGPHVIGLTDGSDHDRER